MWLGLRGKYIINAASWSISVLLYLLYIGYYLKDVIYIHIRAMHAFMEQRTPGRTDTEAVKYFWSIFGKMHMFEYQAGGGNQYKVCPTSMILSKLPPHSYIFELVIIKMSVISP